MNEIKCPHCQTAFTINESQYAQLLEQVRGSEFDREIHDRLERETALLAEQSKNQLQAALAQKDLEVAELKNQLANQASQKELEIRSAMIPKDHEIAALKARLEQVEVIKEQEKLQALLTVEKERDAIKHQLVLQEQKDSLAQQALTTQYQQELAQKDELIAYYKDFKAKQSTKMVGESLEQHCEYEFNRLRMTAFPRAQFGKDNDAKSGSKGDYIYREYDDNGIEIISIMFEMKNESDETATKKKNEQFLKELDKDRREKACEYAILVSLLENDNELYNNGIVDVSYHYPKMYVIRPQFFIPIITLLRNAALNSLEYKQELAVVREQNLDITHFEEDLEAFKTAFAKNYHSANNHFKKAIEEIDKSIARMEAVKKALTTSENQLRLANNKLEDVSVKKLTRKNPTMKAKFDALK
ncbi:DUF2130 domain-containing protein [Streptococcus plurextorum]|uniref:DUF2130 domain-containing protein n=1 Tax=Streptococcus plurextorum TaxID=456876 RepID=UPI00040E67E1|nr:DUF2130 domain-containing protein [Streptococcus plurextorum]